MVVILLSTSARNCRWWTSIPGPHLWRAWHAAWTGAFAVEAGHPRAPRSCRHMPDHRKTQVKEDIDNWSLQDTSEKVDRWLIIVKTHSKQEIHIWSTSDHRNYTSQRGDRYVSASFSTRYVMVWITLWACCFPHTGAAYALPHKGNLPWQLAYHFNIM